MKKSFTTLFLSALTTIMAVTLTACSSSDENETVLPQSGFTEFSAGTKPLDMADVTRTSLDTAYHFFWENGDKIYVKKNGSWTPSSALSLTEKKNFAKFSVNAEFTASESNVEVVYVGQNGTASGANANVTIATAQNQKSWNNATHLGTSGDCGVATATRDASGAYNFTLTHQASYLIFYPYLSSSLSGYKLVSIDIEELNGNQLAGTFGFTVASGLAASATSSGTNKVTLNLGTGGAGLDIQNVAPTTKADGNHCYAVIHPGEHNLKITYHVVNAADATDAFDAVHLLGSEARTFNPNGVSIITQRLSNTSAFGEFDFTFEDTYYCWDAKQWYWYGQSSYPTEVNETNPNHPIVDANNSNRMFNPIRYTSYYESTSAAVNSAKDMPCRTAMEWYLKGGVYYDTTTEWTIGGKTMTGGIWLRKWDYIPNLPANSTKSNCPSGGVERVTPWQGRPSDSEIDKWFFLPKLGSYANASFSVIPGSEGFYWTSSIRPYGSETYEAHFLTFSAASAQLRYDDRAFGLVAGTRPDGTPWFK